MQASSKLPKIFFMVFSFGGEYRVRPAGSYLQAEMG
jgi:hypothetical protein